ncbi:MAG: autotransporter domain-containing protein [Akkermansia sp.]|nr:autotransporter domain-containing protein [Akkermansia sp.]
MTGGTANSPVVVNIIQEGLGSINLINGATFKAGTGKESSITQSGGGTVNLTGDFSKAVFNVDLTDGTLALTTSGTKLMGYTMTLASGVQLDNNGKLTIGTGTEGDAGVLNVTSGGTLNVMLDGTDAAINVGAAAKDTNTVTGWTMASGSTFGIGLKKDYFEKVNVTNNTITINALVADVASGSSVDTNAFECEYTIGEIEGFASEQWKLEDGAGLIIEGDDVYLSATLTYVNYEVHLTEGGEEDRDFAPVGGLDTKLVISENDIILSGDNSHSLGTEINGVEVTLAHENALGAGPVSTKGEAALKTAEDVTANLTGPIGNSGDLSISGKYAMDSGVTLEVADLPAGYICTEGNETADGNGFYREEIKGGGYVAVDNGDDATLTVTPGTTVEYNGEELDLGNDGLIGDRTPEYDTYYIRTDESSGYDVRSSEILTAAKQGNVTEVTVEMTEENGKLTADSAIDVNAVTGTLVTEAGAVVSGTLADTTVQAAGGTIAATISGRSEVTVSGTDVTTISGDNSYEGGTLIDGGSLLVGTATSLGTGDVTLDGHGTLDLNNNAVLNRVVVKGCTIKGASRFGGPLDVEGDLVLKDNTTATTLTMKGKGSITSDPAVSLEVDDVDVQTDADASITANVKVKESITLNNNGNALNVTGSLTLGDVTTLKLVGDYGDGDTLVTSTGDLTKGTVVLDYDSAYMLEQVGNSLVLTLRLKQDKADVAAQSNWGIATTSRAFVDTVRGQHSNTGCIADGRGTVWAAAYGAYNDLDGSDIEVKGAAVGVDAKVGSCSTVGIAFGYAEGEVSPTGLRDADQEGEYVALYGSHGLKKLSSTSCLSLDWVAAYGNTESEWNSLKWEQDSLQLNTRLNWNKKVTERLGMSVFGGLEYFATGSDTADGVKSGSIQNLRGEIGVGARYVAWGTPASQPVLDEKGATLAAARPGCEKLVLNGEIRYFNDMVRSNPVIRMNGASGGGENPGRQGMGIEAGATYRISERWSASANYSFNAMEDSVEHRANVGASYTF